MIPCVLIPSQAMRAELRVSKRQQLMDAAEIRSLRTSLDEKRSSKSRAVSSAKAESTAERNTLRQAHDDKAVLVHALQALTAELATARAQAHRNAAIAAEATERAQRLSQGLGDGLERLLNQCSPGASRAGTFRGPGDRPGTLLDYQPCPSPERQSLITNDSNVGTPVKRHI